MHIHPVLKLLLSSKKVMGNSMEKMNIHLGTRVGTSRNKHGNKKADESFTEI